MKHPNRRPRRLKYNNHRPVVDGERFDSDMEATRWVLLRDKQADGTIENLRRQVPFELVVNDEKVGRYVADFTYHQALPDGRIVEVVEDVKGKATELYRLKRNLMLAIYGIRITEIQKGSENLFHRTGGVRASG